MQELNFEELDQKLTIRGLPELLKIVELEGFSYLSEYIYQRHCVEKNSVRSIARTLKRSRNMPSIWMRKWGFKVTLPQWKTKVIGEEEKEKIRAMKGMTAQQAADKSGRSVQAVRKIWWEIDPPKKQKLDIPFVPDPPPTEQEDKYTLSTWVTRGTSQETWETNQRALELEAWRKHRGDKPSPLGESIARIGYYTGI